MNAAVPLENQPAENRRHLATGNSARTLLLSFAFAALMVTGFYAARDNTSLFRSAVISGIGGLPGGQSALPLGADSLGSDDMVMRFAETRVGHLLFTKVNSDTCERILFDNRTGASYGAGEVFCGRPAAQMASTAAPDRLESLRKTFQK